MARYALTIFLSAFLLFQIQPLIGKYILPWFGGTPAVWTTCMLFFQVLLLAGYSYAHLLASRLSQRRQAVVHGGLLAMSLLFLPIVPQALWKPSGDESPTWRIMLLLTATIGAPYLTLSATGPLLQEWFGRTHPGRSPYRLYALSNLGSLLALITYPVAVEPYLRLGVQANWWSVGYGVFVACCAWTAFCLFRTRNPALAEPKDGETTHGLAGASPFQTKLADSPSDADPAGDSFRAINWAPGRADRPKRGDLVMWLALAAAGSAMLLSTTNQMCQEVAVVPFLWVLPLAVYLLTFIICFDSPAWYLRGVFAVMFGISTVLGCLVLAMAVTLDLSMQIALYCTVLFSACMCLHGELVRSRPNPRYLTLFYLMISAGGALGGVLVAVIAPNVFQGYWEYRVALAGTGFLILAAFFRDRTWILYRGRPWWAWLVFGSAWIALVAFLIGEIAQRTNDAILLTRNFYGALKVAESGQGESQHRYRLIHGQTLHGFQFRNEDRRNWPTTYYGPKSGVGLAINDHPRRLATNPSDRRLRIGVIGLGTGTIAALARKGDYLRFYEINPQVIELAGPNGMFTFLSGSLAECQVVAGDARIQMERELERGEPQHFDVLVVDAFSSDAIPMHLLTREAVAMYWRHLQPDGILAVHVSNRNLDLQPVVRGLGQDVGCEVIFVASLDDEERGVAASDWLLLTRNQPFLGSPVIKAATSPWPAESPSPLLWTDDYGSLMQIIRHNP